MDKKIVRTSQPGWLVEVAQSYRAKSEVLIIDDAKTGINPAEETLYQMGVRIGLTVHEWSAVAIALGVAATGAFLVVTAVLDPEPFSKIGLALAAGTVMTMGGGFMAIRVLTKHKPPKVKIGPQGIEISWEEM